MIGLSSGSPSFVLGSGWNYTPPDARSACAGCRCIWMLCLCFCTAWSKYSEYVVLLRNNTTDSPYSRVLVIGICDTLLWPVCTFSRRKWHRASITVRLRVVPVLFVIFPNAVLSMRSTGCLGDACFSYHICQPESERSSFGSRKTRGIAPFCPSLGERGRFRGGSMRRGRAARYLTGYRLTREKVVPQWPAMRSRSVLHIQRRPVTS